MPDCSTRPGAIWHTSIVVMMTHFPIRHSGGGGGGECFPGCYRLWAGGMVIAQLTHLHISIPASGAPPEEVLEEYFPRDMPSRGLTDPRRISFASGVDSPGWWTAIGSIAGYSDT